MGKEQYLCKYFKTNCYYCHTGNCKHTGGRGRIGLADDPTLFARIIPLTFVAGIDLNGVFIIVMNR